MTSSKRLIVETHSHTIYSKDCLMQPEKIIATCRARGIDRLCVTDHNTMRGAFALAALAPELIIPGEEIMTTKGELLGYFMTDEIPPGLSPMETIAELRRQGAAISVSHPFDTHRNGHWHPADLAAIVPHVDAIEVFNARCFTMKPNRQAQAFANAHALRGTVGSDAHSYRELGRATLSLPPFETAHGFIDALQHATFNTKLSSPFIHFTSRWAVIRKSLAR